MKSISFLLLTVFLSSPCFAQKLVFRANQSGFLSSINSHKQIFSAEDFEELIAVYKSGEMHILSDQMEEGQIIITTAGGTLSFPHSLKKITEEAEKAGVVQFHWNFVVPENYYPSKGIVTHSKPFAELYTERHEGIKYAPEVEKKIWEQPDIIYQSGFSGTPLYGAQGYLPLNGVKAAGPNGGGGGGPYTQFFFWEEGTVSEEQLQRLVEVVEDNAKGIQMIPLYVEEDFNSANAFAQYRQRVVPESVIEAIEKGVIDAASEKDLLYKMLKGQIEGVQKLGVASAFLNYHALDEEDGDTGEAFAVIKAPESSSFGFEEWTAYGYTGKKAEKYSSGVFSHGIEDYSSMKGLMLIGPNGGGGGGPYME